MNQGLIFLVGFCFCSFHVPNYDKKSKGLRFPTFSLQTKQGIERTIEWIKPIRIDGKEEILTAWFLMGLFISLVSYFFFLLTNDSKHGHGFVAGVKLRRLNRSRFVKWVIWYFQHLMVEWKIWVIKIIICVFFLVGEWTDDVVYLVDRIISRYKKGVDI